MNILYINHYAGSLKHGMAFRPYYLAREWIKEGHRVRVIAADFSHLRNQNPQVDFDFQKDLIDGIEYQWVKAGDYHGNGLPRALSMFRFVGKLWLNAKYLAEEFHPDVVISSSTYPLDTFAAQRIAKISGAKYVHEAHDIWPLTLIEGYGMSKWHPFCILLGWAERSAYANTSVLISIIPKTRPHMLNHGLSENTPFVNIPNGIVLEDWEDREPLDELHERSLSELKSAGYFIVLYAGGFTALDTLDVLIEAARLMGNKVKVKFVLVGRGIEKNNFIKQAEGLENVIFLPPVAKKQVPSVLKCADALYVGTKPCSLYRYGVSMNKIYDYMMSGKPTISAVEAANDDIVDAGCGIKVKPGSAEDIVTAVNRMIALTDEERFEMGQQGILWVLKNAEYKSLARKFLHAIGC